MGSLPPQEIVVSAVTVLQNKLGAILVELSNLHKQDDDLMMMQM